MKKLPPPLLKAIFLDTLTKKNKTTWRRGRHFNKIFSYERLVAEREESSASDQDSALLVLKLEGQGLTFSNTQN